MNFFFMLSWRLHFLILLIHDEINAGKIKEQSVGVFFHYLNRFMPRRLYLTRAMLETWHRVHIYPFSIIFVSVF